MTRETKIGLLVGLAFIIVIGILLSEHFQVDTPQAAISSVATSVREGVNAPGTSNPPIVVYAPPEAPPTQRVPTRDELNPAPRPVVPAVPGTNIAGAGNSGASNPIAGAGNSGPASQNTGNNAGGNQIASNNTGTNVPLNPANPPAIAPQQSQTLTRGPATIDPALSEVARRNGEEIVPLDPNGRPPGDDSQIRPPVSPLVKSGNARTYKVQPGDTVSKLAGRFMGGNTKSNRQAIIEANPSLRDDPDKLIVGVAYVIPASTGATALPAAPVETPVVVTPSNQSPVNPSIDAPLKGPQYTYTVAQGDSLWRIANDELGDPAAVDAIKELNRDVLKGKNHDVVIVGTKLRLPAKSVASAN